MKKKNSLSSKDKSAIIIAIVGVIGTITVAYFGFRGNIAPTQISIYATQTAESHKEQAIATSTETPTTVHLESALLATTESTPTPTTPVSLSSQQDFSSDCISADIWSLSSSTPPRELENNCLDLSANGFKAFDEKLSLRIDTDRPKASAIYMQPPQTGTIKLNVKIDKFSAGENSNLVVGVGTVDNWLYSGDFLFYRITDSKIFMVFGESVIDYGENTVNRYNLGSNDTLEFRFNGLDFDIYVNSIRVADDLELPNSPVFWIAYRLTENSSLVAEFSNFSSE